MRFPSLPWENPDKFPVEPYSPDFDYSEIAQLFWRKRCVMNQYGIFKNRVDRLIDCLEKKKMDTIPSAISNVTESFETLNNNGYCHTMSPQMDRLLLEVADPLSQVLSLSSEL